MAQPLPASGREPLPPYLGRHISPATQYFELPGTLRLESGRTLEGVTVAYRTWGDPSNAARNAILICHALTGSADVDAWWPGIISQHGAFDPDTDFIICSNILGSCYGTTGPASLQPDTGVRYRADFPRVTVRDMVEAQRALIDHLGVERLALVTGPSLGGMQALEWALMYPERVESIAPIGVGGRHSAWCIAMSEAQRHAIYADPDWQDGHYTDERAPEKGLAAARMMAICSYRSWHSFDERFGRDERDSGEFEVQSYLRYQGEKINGRFDANTYVRLTQAMNAHDIARGRGDYLQVMKRIRQRALVVSVSSDILYPPHEQQLLARHMPDARHELLHSTDGHDGFLIDCTELAGIIAEFRRLPQAVRGRQAEHFSRLSAVAE
ncbi:MAG TPA: homoserine O-acetyltransferase [Woeseiaceae bacterium]|nr:homoserine O-acetyltransferase [Woeseiaceae bacterium]